MNAFILAVCRLGFAGLSPVMPGTCGSALAAVLAPFLFLPLPFVARVVVLVLVFWLGGMAATLRECYRVLRPGGKISLLVSDSHAFKMVHIQTAELLRIVGERLGYVNAEVVLWQMKNSTSHKYQLRENILILEKPAQ